jgi:hypothetical protein
MDLSFQEKSAWGLLVGIVVVSAFYFPLAFDVVAAAPHPAPLIAISAVGVAAIVIIETVYHIVIAATSRGDTDPDERDRHIDLRAERNSSFVLGAALFTLVGWIVAQSALGADLVMQPLTIAVCILLALTASEVAKLAWQIWYYRTGA